MRKRNKGFTLLEIMIVLGIMGVILAILLPAMSMRKSANIQSTAQTINSLYTAACTWLSHGRTNYTGITLALLTAEGLVPAGFTGTNVYGGAFGVAPLAADAESVVITATAVPAAAGAAIVNILLSNATTAVYAAGTLTVTITY